MTNRRLHDRSGAAAMSFWHFDFVRYIMKPCVEAKGLLSSTTTRRNTRLIHLVLLFYGEYRVKLQVCTKIKEGLFYY